MLKKKRSIVKADKRGYLSRPQAHRDLGEVLGIPEPADDAPREDRKEWDQLYADLYEPFHDPNADWAVIGTGGTSDRIRQVSKGDLFKWAKAKYGREVSKWRPDDAPSEEEVKDARLTDIGNLLDQHARGIWSDSQLIEGIQRVMAFGKSGEEGPTHDHPEDELPQ